MSDLLRASGLVQLLLAEVAREAEHGQVQAQVVARLTR